MIIYVAGHAKQIKKNMYRAEKLSTFIISN